MGALSNPFDPDKILWTGCPCGLHSSMWEHQLAMAEAEKQSSRFYCVEADAASSEAGPAPERAVDEDLPDWDNDEEVASRVVETAVMKGLFGTDVNRRAFLRAVGTGTAVAAISQFFPMDDLKARVLDAKGDLEKKKLNVGFVPITCATPIIMAKPLGFYEKYGLDVDVIKTAGWAVSRDKSLNEEYDAAHMLTPMPLAITVGAGSVAKPWTMPAIENINGQAITLHNKHKDKQDPKKWKGFKFGVPFEYSMHNFLLRYYVTTLLKRGLIQTRTSRSAFFRRLKWLRT